MAKAPTKGLSTLNSMAFGLAVYASQDRLPDTTQDSLPVAGQALLDGVLTRKVPMKGFKVVNYISFPFPKLSWRNRCNRCPELFGLIAFGVSDRRRLLFCDNYSGLLNLGNFLVNQELHRSCPQSDPEASDQPAQDTPLPTAAIFGSRPPHKGDSSRNRLSPHRKSVSWHWRSARSAFIIGVQALLVAIPTYTT